MAKLFGGEISNPEVDILQHVQIGKIQYQIQIYNVYLYCILYIHDIYIYILLFLKYV